MDEGDRRTANAFPGAARLFVVGADRHQLGLAAGAGECRVFSFVVVALFVDQLLVDRFLRQVWRVVDQRHDFFARLLAVGGDAGGGALEDGFDEAHVRFTVRGREVLFGEHVHRVLVFVALRELGLGFDFVQEAADEDRGGGDAGRVHFADRLEPDFVCGRGEEIVAHARRIERLRVGHDELALGAERLQRGTKFGGFGRGDAAAADADVDALYAIVAFGFRERGHGVNERADRALLTKRVRAALVGKTVAQVHREDEFAGQLGLREHTDDCDHQEQQNKEDDDRGDPIEDARQPRHEP